MTGVDLYWLPLGAGGHSVRLNGIASSRPSPRALQRRARRDLYHAALEVRRPDGPVGDRAGALPGADGARARRRGRGRRWGCEPRAGCACSATRSAAGVDGVDPRRRGGRRQPAPPDRRPASAPGGCSSSCRSVPTPVWGRDELRAGEMWNSNSLVSWLIARTGLDVDVDPAPPGRTRARLAGGRRRRPPRVSDHSPVALDLRSARRRSRLAAGHSFSVS